jgi:hypothetical protein
VTALRERAGRPRATDPAASSNWIPNVLPQASARDPQVTPAPGNAFRHQAAICNEQGHDSDARIDHPDIEALKPQAKRSLTRAELKRELARQASSGRIGSVPIVYLASHERRNECANHTHSFLHLQAMALVLVECV